jgi:hypothetical protein
MNISYNSNDITDLCKIMKKYNSDKGLGWHNYTVVYNALFKNIKNNNLKIFELGIGTNNINLPSNMGANGTPGASLRGWKEFFPNSLIYGADIDSNILFNEDRIMTFYCDQTNPVIIKQLWNNTILQNKFDIIIDDGLHEFSANVCFFENSVQKINDNGFYIIEDIKTKDINLFEKKINEWKERYPYLIFKLEKINYINNNFDNNLIIIHKNN